jgi:hypothetical protein
LNLIKVGEAQRGKHTVKDLEKQMVRDSKSPERLHVTAA